MPRTAQSIEINKEKRRSQILQYALRLFALNGYDATSINDIANAIGVSHGLIYHYFDDKEAIFTTLLDHSLALGFTPIFPQLDDSHLEKPAETMRAIINRIIEELKKDDSNFGYYFYLFLNMRFQKTAPLPRFHVPQKDLRPFGIILNLIKAGQSKGVFSSGEPRDLAALFFATFRGLTYAKLHETTSYVFPNSDMILNMFLRKAD